MAIFISTAVQAVIPGIPRTIMGVSGVNQETMASVLATFCKRTGCTIKSPDPHAPYWQVWVGNAWYGTVVGSCDAFQYCVSTGDFDAANLFLMLDHYAYLRGLLEAQGGVVTKMDCAGPDQAQAVRCLARHVPRAGHRAANGGAPITDTGSDRRIREDWHRSKHCGWGTLPDFDSVRGHPSQACVKFTSPDQVVVLGVKDITDASAQRVVATFCAAHGCHPVGSASPWALYTTYDAHMGEWWVGALAGCPSGIDYALCLRFDSQRADVFWTAIKVSALASAFRAAGANARTIECWSIDGTTRCADAGSPAPWETPAR